MADISKEIQTFREAIYGEEVRGSMISLAEKMNKVSEDTEKAEKNRVIAETNRVNAETERDEAEEQRVSAEAKRQQNTGNAITNCNNATDRANEAAQKAEDAVLGKGFVLSDEKGEPGGIATLDDSGKVPDDQIPDISEKTVTFEMATKRANVQSGDSLAVAFGKLALYCADLKPHAFSNPVNNLLGTNPELPLAAPMGAELKRLLDELNGKIDDDYVLKTTFALVEKGNNYILPNFTQMCIVIAQVDAYTSIHTIVGKQATSGSVVGSVIGNAQGVKIQKNSVGNAYINNVTAGALRITIQYC